MNRKQFMKLPLKQTLFDAIYEVKAESLGPVLEQYNINKEELKKLLWKELNIPDMEVRIANTAMDFLIDCCREKKDIQDTCSGMIKEMILVSDVFYANVAPDASCTGDFKIPKE